MDGSGNHDGQQQGDCNGRQQQQWATAVQWAAGRQSNRNGQWDSGIGWTAQMAADDCCRHRSVAMGGWTAVAITMNEGGKIVMDSGSSDGQWRRNGQRGSKAIAMGNGMVASRWMAQWAADNCHHCRSGTMGGDAR
jgi:hypothetical protein